MKLKGIATGLLAGMLILSAGRLYYAEEPVSEFVEDEVPDADAEVEMKAVWEAVTEADQIEGDEIIYDELAGQEAECAEALIADGIEEVGELEEDEGPELAASQALTVDEADEGINAADTSAAGTWEDPVAITTGAPVTIQFTKEDKGQYLKFTPLRSGYYHYDSFGITPGTWDRSIGILYDAEKNKLAENYYYSATGVFKVVYYLEADTSYYLYAGCWEGWDDTNGSGSFGVRVSAYIDPCKVVWDYNGGTSGSETSKTDYFESGTTNRYYYSFKPEIDGYKFMGWALQNDADTALKNVSWGSFKVTESVTYYAVWKKEIKVSWSANGGTMMGFYGTSMTEGDTITYDEMCDPVRNGYDFAGWALKADAKIGDVIFSETRTTYKVTRDVTFYAVWVRNGDLVTVTWDMNGGAVQYRENRKYVLHTENIVEEIKKGGSVFKPSGNDAQTMVKEECVFIGWGLKPDSDETVINGVYGYQVTEDLTLYAIWRETTTVKITSFENTVKGLTITWTADKPMNRYRIIKYDNGKKITFDGISGSTTSFTDTNVHLSKTYRYLIVGEYTDGNGKTVYTQNRTSYHIRAFLDVPMEGYYYSKAVYWAALHNITNGYMDTFTFEPQYICTRAQMVTFLWRAKGKPAPKSTENPFTDLDPSAYYYKAVLWAVENGITKGYEDNTFRPDEECLREHAVMFLWRVAGEPEPASLSTQFVDISPEDYYYKAVLWASEKKIANGYFEDMTYRPKEPCKREHIITFIYRTR